MARYNYKCLDCGNTFCIEATIQEKEGGTSEIFVCPKCKLKNIKQVFSATNFIKNIFKSEGKVGGCCSSGDVCNVNSKSDESGKSDRGDKNSNGGCCG